MQIHAAMLALHTGRPVKIVYDREESFSGHVHRHPARIWAEHRATRDGRLVCVRGAAAARRWRLRLVVARGDLATPPASRSGPYAGRRTRCIEGTVVYTNNPPCGAMRGFGAVQACFAARGADGQAGDGARHRPGRAAAAERARARRHACRPGRSSTGIAPVAEVIRAVRGDAPCRRPRSSPRDPIALPGGAGNTTPRRGRPPRRRLRRRLQEHLPSPRASTTSAPPACGSSATPTAARDPLRRGRGRPGGLERDRPDRAHRARRRRGRARAGGRPRPSARPAPPRPRGMTWMAGGAVQRRLPRRARGARAHGRRRRRRARLPPPPHDAARPGDGADHGRARPRRVRGRRDARRRRGGRRARPRPASSGSAPRRTSARRSTRRGSRARSRAGRRRGSGSR